MPASEDQFMALPLSLVWARFSSSFCWEDMVCIAYSCSGALNENNLSKASELLFGRKPYELSEDSKTLRKLAVWLLCPVHKKETSSTIARAWGPRAWGTESFDNDIFQLLGFGTHAFFERTCPKNGCDESLYGDFSDEDKDDCREVLNILETLTPSEIVRECLSDKKRTKLVKQLVSLLHCKEHRTSENAAQLSDIWNDRLTETIQRRKYRDDKRKKTTPRKRAPYKVRTTSHHKSEVRPAGQTSSKASIGSDSGESGSYFGELFEPQSDPGGPTDEGVLRCATGSGGPGPTGDGSSGRKAGSDSFEPSSEDISGHRFNFDGFESSTSPLTSKLVLDGRRTSPTASQSGSLPLNRSQHSSQKVSVSTAEQTETASPGLKGPGVSRADDRGRHSSSPPATVSPLPKPSLVNGTQGGGSPVTKGLLGPSAAQAVDNPRSHSSSDIHVSGQQPHDSRPSQSRETHSYPNLHSRTSEPEIAVPTHTSPVTPPLESAIFTNKFDREFKPQEIDVKLLRDMRSKRADYGKTPELSSGDVYVLQNPAWPNHVKIGESGRDVDKRIAEIKRDCKIDCLEQALDTEQKYFLNYKMVEKLCHEELKNFRKDLQCEWCKTKNRKRQRHEEWFEVKPEIAVRTVQKWRKWMLTSPYNDDGYLKPWWRHKATSELIKEQPFEERIGDDESRHERWSRWLENPTVGERAHFEIEKFLFHPRSRRKSLWNTAEENLIPLLIYTIVVWFICEPKQWLLVVLLLLWVLRDWV